LLGRQFPSVLVGFDGSADSVEALRVGVALAGHGVVALSIVRPAGGYEPHENEAEPGSVIRARAWDHLVRIRRELDSADIEMHAEVVVSDKDAATVLAEYASDHAFALVVLGRHGDGVLHRQSRLGRVADLAARASSRPVLLVSAR
jgi:nucleotide-binding universal stress UspA family protein